MCRTERYKYVRRLYERDELYDLAADPGETRNLAADQPRLRAQLEADYRRWEEDVKQDASPRSPVPEGFDPSK